MIGILNNKVRRASLNVANLGLAFSAATKSAAELAAALEKLKQHSSL